MPHHPSDRIRCDALGPDGVLRCRTRDVAEAQKIVSDVYMPHDLSIAPGSSLNLELVAAPFGRLTAGRVTYGSPAEVSTDEANELLVTMTLRGRAASRSGSRDWVVTTSGAAAVFQMGEPLHITGSNDCLQLCVMVPRQTVEESLERLLGRSLREPLRFDQRLTGEVVRVVQPALQLIMKELARPSGLVMQPPLSRHLEGLFLDGLLVGQPHNHQDAIRLEGSAGHRGAIARAAALMDEQPARAWSVLSLAQEVHLSVRALQYGFRREYDMAPMTYLRTVRLRRAHSVLAAADPGSTTVRAVALVLGFLHTGRFAANYRELYGEAPSATLMRRPR